MCVSVLWAYQFPIYHTITAIHDKLALLTNCRNRKWPMNETADQQSKEKSRERQITTCKIKVELKRKQTIKSIDLKNAPTEAQIEMITGKNCLFRQ